MPQEQAVTMHQLEQTINSGWSLVNFAAYPDDDNMPWGEKSVPHYLSVGLCDRNGLMDGRRQFLTVQLDPANVQADLVRIKAFIAAAQKKWVEDLADDLRVVEADLLESNTLA